MSCTVFANSRGVSHKGSGGMSPIFPDVCKTPTPGGPIPIPYPNIGKSADTTSGPTSVKNDGQMPMTKEAQYMMYSFDVKYEGKNVCRLGDPLFHNDKNAMG